MAAGFGVPQRPGTSPFAPRFHEAGFHVLAFDYRGLGESGGVRRQVVRVGDQLKDWDAALSCAAELPGVDPHRLVIWGFSLSGGHVFRVAAAHPGLAGAIAVAPNVDGPAAARNAARSQTVAAMARLAGRASLDLAGRLVGRPSRLVPLAAPRGTVAALTTPDALDGARAIPGAWPRVVAAGSAVVLGSYRPGRAAPRVTCPLLVVVSEHDQSALALPAERAALAAPRGELVRVSGGHYASYLESHEASVEAQLSFLARCAVEDAGATWR
jgi:pimeloyl-ACP methyl ester carboxylesterase